MPCQRIRQPLFHTLLLRDIFALDADAIELPLLRMDFSLCHSYHLFRRLRCRAPRCASHAVDAADIDADTMMNIDADAAALRAAAWPPCHYVELSSIAAVTAALYATSIVTISAITDVTPSSR